MNLPTDLSQVDLDPTHDDDILAKAQEAYVKKEVDQRVKKILKKNRREITRLKAWAEKSMIEGNKFGYVYAIQKLRRIYRQKPLSTAEADEMWNRNNAALILLAREEMVKMKQEVK